MIIGLAGGNISAIPWKKMEEEPACFYEPDLLPTDVWLKDPSRMSVPEIDKIFNLWLSRQALDQPPFQFHHIWIGSVYVPAIGRKPVQPELNKTSATLIDVTEKTIRKKRTGKEKARVTAPKSTKTKQNAERSDQSDALPAPRTHIPEVLPGLGDLTSGSLTSFPADSGSTANRPGFGTNGPNDPVPFGYNPIPIDGPWIHPLPPQPLIPGPVPVINPVLMESKPGTTSGKKPIQERWMQSRSRSTR